MRLWLLASLIMVLSALPDTALGQSPRRPSPTGFTRDTISSALKMDSIPRLRLLSVPVVQDSSRQCRSTTGYVLFGGFVGFLFGSARYEKGMQHGDGDFAPWLTMPLAIGPYVLGGMLLGHLIAPC